MKDSFFKELLIHSSLLDKDCYLAQLLSLMPSKTYLEESIKGSISVIKFKEFTENIYDLVNQVNSSIQTKR